MTNDGLPLFRAASGERVTKASLLGALRRLGAAGHDIIYVHTDVSFGQVNPDLRREDILRALYEILLDLGAGTLLVPTFTFSFCNGEDYDVRLSRSKMGALNEYVRKLPEAQRSVDPLMSSALVGEKKRLVEGIGKNSVGEGSTFDLLHREDDVLFLFLGVRPAKCFTYSHYVEERLRVPYRYNRPFSGRIVDDAGRTYSDTYQLFVRYKDVAPTKDDEFERDTVARGLMRQLPCGDGVLSCIDERTAYRVYEEKIQADVNYMLERPFPDTLVDEFFAKGMVAL
jgi:aminoglycoside 3-N-acetyltransferase